MEADGEDQDGHDIIQVSKQLRCLSCSNESVDSQSSYDCFLSPRSMNNFRHGVEVRLASDSNSHKEVLIDEVGKENIQTTHLAKCGATRDCLT